MAPVVYITAISKSSIALTGNFAPLEHDMCCLRQAPNTSPPGPLSFNIGRNTISKKLSRLLEILHHLSIASFQKRICRKVETTILSLGGTGDSNCCFHTVALWHLSSGAKSPSKAVKSTLLLIVFEVNMIACEQARRLALTGSCPARRLVCMCVWVFVYVL